MKGTIKKMALIAIALGLTIASCKKNTDETPTPAVVQTKTQLLTAKNWKITAETISPAYDWNGNGVLVTDIFAQMTPCEKDNLVIFNVNGTVTYDEGPTKCVETDPQTTYGTWAFNPLETIITLDSTNFYNLEILNSTTLKMNTVFQISGVDYTFTFTCTKQ